MLVIVVVFNPFTIPIFAYLSAEKEIRRREEEKRKQQEG